MFRRLIGLYISGVMRLPLPLNIFTAYAICHLSKNNECLEFGLWRPLDGFSWDSTCARCSVVFIFLMRGACSLGDVGAVLVRDGLIMGCVSMVNASVNGS